jgi:hypothetical protein
MEFSTRKLLMIAAAALLSFAFAAGLILQFLPGPRKDSDYMVAGAVATAAALAVCFAAVLTDERARQVIFRKRDK